VSRVNRASRVLLGWLTRRPSAWGVTVRFGGITDTGAEGVGTSQRCDRRTVRVGHQLLCFFERLFDLTYLGCELCAYRSNRSQVSCRASRTGQSTQALMEVIKVSTQRDWRGAV
jgi:hypothetical protein